jgi:hypothetical protein
MSIRSAALVIAVITSSHSAYAHGIAGNRYFAGTLTFDDPAVADEAIVSYYTYFEHPSQGSSVNEDGIEWSFADC